MECNQFARALITPISPLEDTLNPAAITSAPIAIVEGSHVDCPIVPTTMEIGANHNPKPIAEKNKVIKAPVLGTLPPKGP